MTYRSNARDLPDFKYRGARASVVLHEEQLRRFAEVWKQARTSGASLPDVDDPDYVSFDALFVHVFRWARAYLIWICEQLGLPEPGIRPLPNVDVVASEAGSYLEHVLDAWRTPLHDIPEERFFNEIYASPWGVPFCVDAMLEHAVMHPIKHRFQLEELMGVK